MDTGHAVYVEDPATAHNDNLAIDHQRKIVFLETAQQIAASPPSLHGACIENDHLRAVAPLGKNPQGISEGQHLFPVPVQDIKTYSRDVLYRQFDDIRTTQAAHKNASADAEYVAILHSGGKTSKIDYLGFSDSGRQVTLRDCAYTGPLDAANDRPAVCRMRHFVLKENAV